MTPARWAECLIDIARPVLADDPVDLAFDLDARRAFAETFRDEMTARPSVVAPFLADLVGVPAPPEPGDATPDDALWYALAHGTPNVADLVRPDAGPLLRDPADQTSIEVRTESELIALHALSEVASRRENHGLHARCRAAALWHLAELQPDNATNHPWAIQVFIRLACDEAHTDTGASALVHAQTQLHSSQVALGRPDRLSACILLHAARSLERAPGRPSSTCPA